MSYPGYMHVNLGDLAGYLLEPPDTHELDERGCLSKESCAKIDSMLLKDFEKKLKGQFFPEEQEKGTDPNNRWRTVSCLQKAIRFGNRDMARFAASVGYDMDAKYVLRRLGIIAVEDVAMGNLYGVLVTLAAMGNSAWRKACDERRLCIALADTLASAHQDRNLTDLLNMTSFDTTFDHEEVCKKTNEELAEQVLDHNRKMSERMAALWAMAGTKKFWGHNMPKWNDRPPTPVFQLMAEQGLSRAMLFGAARTASRLNEAFWVNFFFAHEQLQGCQMGAISDPLPEYPKVGKLLGAAYDVHTREGKASIAKFAQSCKELKPYASKLVEGGDFVGLVGYTVFAVEGGRLKDRVVYGNSEEIRAESWQWLLLSMGLQPSLQDEFKALVQANLPFLNKIRESVLWAKLS